MPLHPVPGRRRGRRGGRGLVRRREPDPDDLARVDVSLAAGRVVVAADRETARRAAALIVVMYSPQRPIVDAVTAIDDPEDAV